MSCLYRPEARVQTLANPRFKTCGCATSKRCLSASLPICQFVYLWYLTHHLTFFFYSMTLPCTNKHEFNLFATMRMSWCIYCHLISVKVNLVMLSFMLLSHIIPLVSCVLGVAVSCPGISTETSLSLLPLWTMMWNFSYFALFSSGSGVPSHRCAL